MIIHFTLNGMAREMKINPGENVQKLLFSLGMHSVRNSDDGFGFAGSDAILYNGRIVNASLLIAAQLDHAEIRTSESLGKWNALSLVQQAMGWGIGGGLLRPFHHLTGGEADDHHVVDGHQRVIHAGGFDHQNPFIAIDGADVAPGQGHQVMFGQRQVGVEHLTFEIF